MNAPLLELAPLNDPVYWLGYVVLLLMPLVATSILYVLVPLFGGTKSSFGFSMNAGIYGIVGLIPPAILLYLVPLFISVEDRHFTITFYSVLGLILHMLTIFLATEHFHKLSRRATLALSTVVFTGCWLYAAVFAGLPKFVQLILTVPEV